MKINNGLGNPIIIADIPGKGYCKIIFDSHGTIVKAFIGSPDKCQVLIYSERECDSDSCLKDAMREMCNISPSDFIEMFTELTADDQIACAREIASTQKAILVSEAQQMLEFALMLNQITED